MLAKQVWDGGIDPFIGVISDATRSRFGRRKPYCLLAIVPCVVFWVLQWTAPGDIISSDKATFAYFAVALLGFSLFWSLYNVPHQATVPDMATTYKSRTRLVFMMRVFLLLGTGIATFAWQRLVNAIPPQETEEEEGMPADYRRGYLFAALVIGCLTFGFQLIGALSIREIPVKRDMDTLYKTRCSRVSGTLGDMASGIARMALFVPFILLVCIHALGGILMASFTSNLVLYFKYNLGMPNTAATALLTLQGSVLLSMVVWLGATKLLKFKIVVYMTAMAVVLGAFISIWFLTSETPVWAIILTMALLGFGSSGTLLMTHAMVPDVIELFQTKYGLRIEALFYSVFGFLDTLAVGLSSLIAGYVLAAAGYQSPSDQETVGEQPESALNALHLLVSGLPIILIFATFPVAVLYLFIVELRFKKLKAAQEAEAALTLDAKGIEAARHAFPSDDDKAELLVSDGDLYDDFASQ